MHVHSVLVSSVHLFWRGSVQGLSCMLRDCLSFPAYSVCRLCTCASARQRFDSAITHVYCCSLARTVTEVLLVSGEGAAV
eukprot:5058307-Pyramimonas_sp.AAC.1